MLQLENINTYYGYSHILQGISLEVKGGEIVVLLGRNGVGKTTTMKTIMGIQPPKDGKVIFCNENIAGLPPYKIAQKGISLIPEDRRVIPNLTVHENLRLGSLILGKGNNREHLFEAVLNYFPRLKERLRQYGASLSGGEQQMLTIARGLMAKPKLILIDEPSEGLAPMIVYEIMEIIKKLQDDGVTILLVEQHVEMAMRLSQNLRAYIMEKGQIRMCGNLEELTCKIDEVVHCLGVKI
ncbi:MAG TPA: ABC transporter ATP-binding protein [Thermodesulfobacteriota bacterium]|nr:ABC transporter ATP-binding protein [Thermodesulfobacteriota bacterium]